MVLNMSPSEIRFTQESISDKFHDGEHTVLSTFKDIYLGNVSADSLPMLHVVRDDSNTTWVVKGNRRLFVYKKLQEYGKLNTVKVRVKPMVEELFKKMYSTTCDGARIRIRGGYRQGDQTQVINNQIRNFVSEQRSPSYGGYSSWGETRQSSTESDSFRYQQPRYEPRQESSRPSAGSQYGSNQRPQNNNGLLADIGTGIINAVSSAWRWLTG